MTESRLIEVIPDSEYNQEPRSKLLGMFYHQIAALCE